MPSKKIIVKDRSDVFMSNTAYARVIFAQRTGSAITLEYSRTKLQRLILQHHFINSIEIMPKPLFRPKEPRYLLQ